MKKVNLTNSCISVKKTKKTKKTAPTGTLAGSPPPSGSDSLGLSSFEDRNSSQKTSQVSLTPDNQGAINKTVNTCDEKHPSVSGSLYDACFPSYYHFLNQDKVKV